MELADSPSSRIFRIISSKSCEVKRFMEWLCSFSWRWIGSGSCKSLKFCLLPLCGGRRKVKIKISTIEGMPLLTPHCCRVTYVSIMQALGVKLETISHLVGHTTTRITESRYLRVQNEACQDALYRFDQRFGVIGRFSEGSKE